ncbi:MAG: hypothetical protein PHF51_03020 [Candidatus ainarchaeum sp.]|nr:hypothetical protein [Candidatus ainarchaeum sp.]
MAENDGAVLYVSCKITHGKAGVSTYGISRLSQEDAKRLAEIDFELTRVRRNGPDSASPDLMPERNRILDRSPVRFVITGKELRGGAISPCDVPGAGLRIEGELPEKVFFVADEMVHAGGKTRELVICEMTREQAEKARAIEERIMGLGMSITVEPRRFQDAFKRARSEVDGLRLELNRLLHGVCGGPTHLALTDKELGAGDFVRPDDLQEAVRMKRPEKVAAR